MSVSYVTLSVSRSYVTRLFEVDTDFKNVFMLKINVRENFLNGKNVENVGIEKNFEIQKMI